MRGNGGGGGDRDRDRGTRGARLRGGGGGVILSILVVRLDHSIIWTTYWSVLKLHVFIDPASFG